MNLQELLKDTKYYQDNLLIAELKNGYAIGYERREKGLITAVVIPADNSSLSFNSGSTFTLNGDNSDSWDNCLPSSTCHVFKEYRLAHTSAITKLEQDLQQLYQQALQPLKIKEVPDRPSLKYLVLSLAMTAGFPILAPLSLVFASLIGFSGPFMLANYCREMVAPTTTYFQVGNKKALVPKEEGNVAVDFIGEGPRKFFETGVIFPDGKELFKDGKNIGGKNDYLRASVAQYYLALPPELNQQLQEKMKVREQEVQEWQQFQKSVTNEDHLALLKHLKFMEE